MFFQPCHLSSDMTFRDNYRIIHVKQMKDIDR